MKLSSFALLAILASTLHALPNAPVSRANALTSTVNLFNGVDTTTVTVAQTNTSTELLPEGTLENMCRGSVRCTNKQWFRDQCMEAYYKLEHTVYSADGQSTGGVCAGNCGMFIEGKGCAATSQEFDQAYESIRTTNNCLACGVYYKPRTSRETHNPRETSKYLKAETGVLWKTITVAFVSSKQV
ncbi:hypothetical protein O988_05580 [Pseudogymnoascus sp. VKM F-3808]|nr:hypothetical protein O988_05580 [Pseudogymnoascus sp. VKM F-3808]